MIPDLTIVVYVVVFKSKFKKTVKFKVKESGILRQVFCQLNIVSVYLLKPNKYVSLKVDLLFQFGVFCLESSVVSSLVAPIYRVAGARGKSDS